jgi:hypothetical protein
VQEPQEAPAIRQRYKRRHGVIVPAALPGRQGQKSQIAGMDRGRALGAGEAAVVPAGQPHLWWNAGQDQLHVLVEVQPALRTEVFFETFFGLASDGKTNRKGLPNPVRWALLARE